MIKKNTKNNRGGFPEKTSESIKKVKKIFLNSISDTPPSDDFRETLLKSGLDIATFQTDEATKAVVSDDGHSTDFTGNESAKKQTSRNILESAKGDTKILPRFGRWYHLTMIGGIAAIIVLQSVFQFTFIQNESTRAVEDLSKNALPVEQILEKDVNIEVPRTETTESKRINVVETKNEYKKTEPKILAQPKKSAPKIQRELRENPARTILRKREQRETTAERIRRTEKILTGV